LWLDVATEEQAGLPDRFVAAAFIATCLQEGRRLLLHASPGRHRTRWAFVAHQIWAGAAPKTAIRAAERPPWMSPYATNPDRWQEFAALASTRNVLA
jgi:hypothetical protein